ncbi:MAG TPA: SAVED domain-containing protein [Solirubrobacteraceae bacterium]
MSATVGPRVLSPVHPTGFVSYAHADGAESVDRLVQELRLRGVTVIRDIEAFRAGRSLGGEMADAIEADLVLAHLGRGALESEAVMQRELGPALWQSARHGSPVVVIVPHGIGDTREQVDATIKGRLPYSAEATWAPAPEPDGEALSHASAAAAARASLRSLYGPARGEGAQRREVLLLTRGDAQHGDGLVIDATGLTGGPARRFGAPADWARVKNAIDDLATTLGAHGPARKLTVTANAHATGGFLFGRAFNRPAQWELRLTGPAGDCVPSTRRSMEDLLELRVDGSHADRRLLIGIDLASRQVATAIDRLCAEQGARPGTIVVFERRNSGADLTTCQISDAAAAISTRIKALIDERSPARIDLFIAAPSTLPVLLSAEMATLGLPIGLWEHDDAHYVHTLDLNP